MYYVPRRKNIKHENEFDNAFSFWIEFLTLHLFFSSGDYMHLHCLFGLFCQQEPGERWLKFYFSNFPLNFTSAGSTRSPKDILVPQRSPKLKIAQNQRRFRIKVERRKKNTCNLKHVCRNILIEMQTINQKFNFEIIHFRF